MSEKIRSSGISVFVLLFPFAIISCTPSPSEETYDYLERLSRTLEVSIPPPPEVQLPERPDNASIVQTIDNSSITLVDYLKITGCRISHTLGYKNSQLGKVAAPSQIMHIERDLLIHLPECIRTLSGSQPELSLKLDKAYKLKEEARMKIWWNAWITSKEWQALTSSASLPLDMPHQKHSHNEHLSLSVQALRYAINQKIKWFERDYEYESSDMELHLQQLSLGESVGRWQRAIQLLIKTLTQATDMLNLKYREQPLCSTGGHHLKTDILNNVFNKIYAGEIQPYLSLTDRFGDQILPLLEDLRTEPASPTPPGYLIWLSDLQKLQKDLDQANLNHVEAWKRTLKECGMLPGS